MLTQTLVVNLRGTSWDMVPHDLWSALLRRFAVRYCNGISFDDMSDLSTLSSFVDSQPAPIRDFVPKSEPDNDITAPDSVRHVFAFDSWVAHLMASDRGGMYVIGDGNLPIDNVYLWRDDALLIHSDIQESHIYFYSLTAEMRSDLLSVDDRIRPNLYAG